MSKKLIDFTISQNRDEYIDELKQQISIVCADYEMYYSFTSCSLTGHNYDARADDCMKKLCEIITECHRVMTGGEMLEWLEYLDMKDGRCNRYIRRQLSRIFEIHKFRV